METVTAPRGLIAELITPLKNNGTIDPKGCKTLLDRIIPHIQGLFLAGPRYGEGMKLDGSLRFELLQCAFHIIGRRDIPLFVWISGESAAETFENVRFLEKKIDPIDAANRLFWVDTPLIYHSNRGLPDFYRELCGTLNHPLILNNDPFCINAARPFKRHNIRTAILKELAQQGDIAGLIFSGTLERAHHYQRACRNRPDFRIYDGEERRFLEHPSMSGVVSVGANLAPEAWQKITRSSLQLHAHRENYPDRLHQIWQLGDFLSRLANLYENAPAQIIKEILMDMGVIQSAFSYDAFEMEPKDVQELKDTMRNF